MYKTKTFFLRKWNKIFVQLIRYFQNEIACNQLIYSKRKIFALKFVVCMKQFPKDIDSIIFL